MKFIGMHRERSKMIIGSEVTEQIGSFNCLGCNISYVKRNWYGKKTD